MAQRVVDADAEAVVAAQEASAAAVLPVHVALRPDDLVQAQVERLLRQRCVRAPLHVGDEKSGSAGGADLSLHVPSQRHHVVGLQGDSGALTAPESYLSVHAVIDMIEFFSKGRFDVLS